jgi:hypothetical protein
MSEFNPDKLFVKYIPPVNKVAPIVGRRYTLTHSDDTGDLFLTIALNYDYSSINPMRDEVLAEWVNINFQLTLIAYCQVDLTGEYTNSKIRYKIFKRELPLALKAICNGDKSTYETHPYLRFCPIYVRFISKYHEFNKLEYWGTPQNYFDI